MRQDVEKLANIMTKIASNPENYKPIKVIDPRFDKVKMGETYIIYAPDLKENVTPEIQAEIDAAANIRVLLVSLANSFKDVKSSFYVGSRHGWFICSSVFPGEAFSPVTDDELYKYDPRKRPWYKNAIDAGGAVFSDIYTNIDTDEYQLIGCSAPYYDKNGVAGVVGLDVSSQDIYKIISETANGYSFVLNKSGEVIFSSLTEGVLAAKEGGGDIRKSSQETLARAALKMTEGQSGIFPVTIDGEEYYLAFAPMKNIGWSFGTLTPRKDIVAAAEESRAYFLAQVDDFMLRLKNEFFLLVLAGIILLGGLIYVFLSASREASAKFVQPINELSDGVRDIASGNLDKKLNIKTGDEIQHLAVCFNAMTDELKAYMENLTKATAERERIATELDVAKDIQNGMLPKDFPTRADV